MYQKMMQVSERPQKNVSFFKLSCHFMSFFLPSQQNLPSFFLEREKGAFIGKLLSKLLSNVHVLDLTNKLNQWPNLCPQLNIYLIQHWPRPEWRKLFQTLCNGFSFLFTLLVIDVQCKVKVIRKFVTGSDTYVTLPTGHGTTGILLLLISFPFFMGFWGDDFLCLSAWCFNIAHFSEQQVLKTSKQEWKLPQLLS